MEIRPLTQEERKYAFLENTWKHSRNSKSYSPLCPDCTGKDRSISPYLPESYVSKWLDGHMKEARKEIRFIDPHYQEKFRIPDGGKIIITTKCLLITSSNPALNSSVLRCVIRSHHVEKNSFPMPPKSPMTFRAR